MDTVLGDRLAAAATSLIVTMEYLVRVRSVFHTSLSLIFYSKLPSCSARRLAGRMAIYAMKVEDFHNIIIC